MLKQQEEDVQLQLKVFEMKIVRIQDFKMKEVERVVN
jgi:hypothetical protein